MSSPTPNTGSQYQRIDDAFAGYCKQPIGTSISELIGDHAVRLIEHSARASGRTKFVRLVSGVAATALGLVAFWFIAHSYPLVIAGPPALIAGLWGGTLLRTTRQREEPDEAKLSKDATPDQKRNFHSLDEFRNRLSDGQLPCEQRLPDGTRKALSVEHRRCFIADHGRVLIVSRDQSLWMKIRSRPVPLSDLWVGLQGTVGSAFITSRTLINMDDGDRFDRRLQWLLEKSQGDSREAVAFRNNLNLIVMLRRPSIKELSLEKKIEEVRHDSAQVFTASVTEKIHSGNYGPFERFLHALPLSEMP
jgi:hypothetical protein